MCVDWLTGYLGTFYLRLCSYRLTLASEFRSHIETIIRQDLVTPPNQVVARPEPSNFSFPLRFLHVLSPVKNAMLSKRMYDSVRFF